MKQRSRSGSSRPTPTRRWRWTLPGRACGIVALVGLISACDKASGPTTGSLQLTLSGLPAGAFAQIVVTGPNSFSQTYTASTTIPSLPPGAYTVSAPAVFFAEARYAVPTVEQTFNVVASKTPINVPVGYALVSGALTLNIVGTPPGRAVVRLTGPGNFDRAVGTSGTFAGLEPGRYHIAASETTVGGQRFAPIAAAQDVDVSVGLTAVTAVVQYAQITGTLAVSFSGLPCNAPGAAAISGPDIARTIASDVQITGARAGTYTITASPVTVIGQTYNPTRPTQDVKLDSAGTVNVEIAYATTAGGPNLVVTGAYIVQVVQTPTGTVPLVANRSGLLRVFVAASQSNIAAPPVRVRFYSNGALASTVTIPAPQQTASSCRDEGTVATTWNYVVPAALMQPNLRMLVDVDPANVVAEANENDNQFPVNGEPLPLDVRVTTPLPIRFVPVAQSPNGNGLTGSISEPNGAEFTPHMLKMFPVQAIDPDVHAIYTTTLPVLQSGDANSSWTTLLGEINALRVAEGSDRHYYGVVKVSYTSGVAGYGYVPGRAAVGWDYLPSGPQIAAHEVGHNLGRLHAPCGGAGGPDPNFPYTGGTIGMYGYDVEAAAIKPPDLRYLMGYCGFQWISDYNYVGIFNNRTPAGPAFAASAVAAARQPRRSLIVWGRAEGDRLVLEPSFSVVTVPVLPNGTGPYHIEGMSESGRRMFSYAFEATEVADAPAGSRQFAFAIPLDSADEASLQSIRLSEGARSVMRSAAPEGAGALARESAPTAERIAGGGTQVSWRRAGALPIAVVRDRRTGEIISLARGGSAALRAQGADLEVVLSDGVRSSAQTVIVR